jgi:hypothetical protein
MMVACDAMRCGDVKMHMARKYHADVSSSRVNDFLAIWYTTNDLSNGDEAHASSCDRLGLISTQSSHGVTGDMHAG